jgi:hypothetical protein
VAFICDPFKYSVYDVKRIVDGVTYDTETATKIATGDHGHELSQAWWTLYQTSQGSFFEVVAGHDGVVEEFNPLTNNQARRFLEVNANALVEKHFGPMAEPRPPRFSRRTVVAAVEVLEDRVKTHADLTRRLLKWNPELAKWCDGGSLPDRFNHLIKFFDERPHFRLEEGNLLADELVELAASMLGQSFSATSPQVDAFRRALDLDGFIVTDGVLRRTLPATLKLPEAADETSRLLTKHRFAIAQGHLKQAYDNHADGNWASANAQIRNFLDGLLDEIAVRIDPSSASLSSGQPRRTRLAMHGFLSRDLNEWDDKGLGFINGLMKRLHPQGSHPGLSDQDDCTFRLHTVLLTARLLLVRFDARP